MLKTKEEIIVELKDAMEKQTLAELLRLSWLLCGKRYLYSVKEEKFYDELELRDALIGTWKDALGREVVIYRAEHGLEARTTFLANPPMPVFPRDYIASFYGMQEIGFTKTS